MAKISIILMNIYIKINLYIFYFGNINIRVIPWIGPLLMLLFVVTQIAINLTLFKSLITVLGLGDKYEYILANVISPLSDKIGEALQFLYDVVTGTKELALFEPLCKNY